MALALSIYLLCILWPCLILQIFLPLNSEAQSVGTPSTRRCSVLQATNFTTVLPGGGRSGTCAEIARQQTPVDTHSAYGQSLLFGIGAAVAGIAGYATLLIVLKGATIGYFSFGVGYLVGWTMMKGSKGLGGRNYQITAALLTYAAVSVSAVPFELALI